MDHSDDIDDIRQETTKKVRRSVQRTKEIRQAILADDWPIVRTVRQGPGHRVCQILRPDRSTNAPEPESHMGRSTIVRLNSELRKVEKEFGSEWKFNPDVPSFFTVVPLIIENRRFHAVVSYNPNRHEWVAMILHENNRGARSGVDENAVAAVREAVDFTINDLESTNA